MMAKGPAGPHGEAGILAWTRLREALYGILFPPRCAGCGQPGPLLCDRCIASIQPVPLDVCFRCGRPIRSAQHGRCASCSAAGDPLAGYHSVAYSAGPLRSAIHRLKFRGQYRLAAPLAVHMVDWWHRYPVPADLIVPVPLHPARERVRGYNQSALLSRHLARAIGLPVDEGRLRRLRNTPPQVGLSARERQANVAGAFACAVPGAVAGRQVLLVDDLMTTGATLRACAAALDAAGARVIWAFTLARAAPHETH